MSRTRRATTAAALVAAGAATILGVSNADAAVRTPWTSGPYPTYAACTQARNAFNDYDARSAVKTQCFIQGPTFRFSVLAR